MILYESKSAIGFPQSSKTPKLLTHQKLFTRYHGHKHFLLHQIPGKVSLSLLKHIALANLSMDVYLRYLNSSKSKMKYSHLEMKFRYSSKN